MVYSQTIDVIIDWLEHFVSDFVLKVWVADGFSESGDFLFTGLDQLIESVTACTDSFSDEFWTVLKVFGLGDWRHCYSLLDQVLSYLIKENQMKYYKNSFLGW